MNDFDLPSARNQFLSNISGIRDLTSFDGALIQFMVASENQVLELARRVGKEVVAQAIEKNVTQLQNIHNNKTLRKNFLIVYNQAIVLLVSHLSTFLEDVFRLAVGHILETESNPTQKLLDEEIKTNVGEMIEGRYSLNEFMVNRIVERKGISFQDMQSTRRSLEDFVGVLLPHSELMETIIFIQASRNLIVHNSSRINERFLNQISKTENRRVKSDLGKVEVLDFSYEEISLCIDSIQEFGQMVYETLEERLRE